MSLRNLIKVHFLSLLQYFMLGFQTAGHGWPQRTNRLHCTSMWVFLFALFLKVFFILFLRFCIADSIIYLKLNWKRGVALFKNNNLKRK